MSISREDLVAKLRLLRPNQNNEAYRAVASDLYYSGAFIEASQLDGEDALLERMFLAYSTKTKQSRVMAEDPFCCPLCKARLTPIKLNHDVRAVWCSRHFVVYPCKD